MVTDTLFLQNICPYFFNNSLIHGILATIYKKIGAKKYAQLW
jgi:hypothetical protein